MSQYTLATSVMPEEYKYMTEQCDVHNKDALIAFRKGRQMWLTWLETDEHHAIWQVVWSMISHDVTYRIFVELANHNPDSAIHNPLLGEALVNGYFATQVLAIRRLMDNESKDRISLPRLINDVRKNFRLFTRENFVGFDGLPYDYEAAQQRVMLRELAKGGGPFWGERTGPDAAEPAHLAHKHFDRLAGIHPERRRRDDRLPKAIIDTLDSWLKDDVIDEIVKWSHTFLAHAAGPGSPNRDAIAKAAPTVDKITTTIKCFVRVAGAVTNCILRRFESAVLFPVPQFNQFEKLDKALMATNDADLLRAHWDRFAEERNAYLQGIEGALISGTHI